MKVLIASFGGTGGNKVCWVGTYRINEPSFWHTEREKAIKRMTALFWVCVCLKMRDKERDMHLYSSAAPFSSLELQRWILHYYF